MLTLFAAALALAPVTADLKVTASRPMVGVRAIAVAAAPTGSKIAITAEDNSVRIYDAATRVLVRTMTGHSQPAMAITWSADGTLIATGDESARIFIWDARIGARLKVMQGHTRGIQALSFNPARTLLLSTGKDDAVKIWDVASGKVKFTILGKGANLFGATYRGKLNDFGLGTLAGAARLYGGDTKIKGFMIAHGNQGVFDIDFNRAGTRALTCGRDANGGIWDVAKYKRLNYLRGHTDWVVHGKFAPKGKYVATGSSDRTVRVWNVFSYRCEIVLENQSAVGSPVAWTGNGKYLVTVNIGDFLTVNSLSAAQ